MRAALQEHSHAAAAGGDSAAAELQGAALGLGAEHEIEDCWVQLKFLQKTQSHLEAGESFKEGLVLLQRGSQRHARLKRGRFAAVCARV